MIKQIQKILLGLHASFSRVCVHRPEQPVLPPFGIHKQRKLRLKICGKAGTDDGTPKGKPFGTWHHIVETKFIFHFAAIKPWVWLGPSNRFVNLFVNLFNKPRYLFSHTILFHGECVLHHLTHLFHNLFFQEKVEGNLMPFVYKMSQDMHSPQQIAFTSGP